MVANTVKLIVLNNKVSFANTSKIFLKSKTYKIIQNAGEEFYEDEAEQFYELCKNKCKYGQPIENRDIIKK